MSLPDVTVAPASGSIGREEDQQLIRAIADRDQSAFGVVYQKYNRRIYNYLRHIIQDEVGAEDVLQEVFLAVWQGAARFKQKSSVKTWIYRIAYKQSITWLRRHPRKNNQIGLDDVTDEGSSPEEGAISDIRSAQLQKAMANLTPKHRAVLELAFLQEMSYADIAVILDCPVGTVKSRMSYALRNLSHRLLLQDVDHKEYSSTEK